MNTKPRTRVGRKLLIAAIGVAALEIGACETGTSGNLVAPPPEDAATPPDAQTLPDAGTPSDGGTTDAM